MTIPVGAAAHLGPSRVHVEPHPSGGMRVTCPAAPGWAAVASSPVALARAVEEGMREAQVAAYAARRGERYDLAAHDQAAEEAAAVGRQLPADESERAAVLAALPPPVSTGHELAWRPLPDGTWSSPSGRRYGPQTQVVQRLIAKRAAMGVGVPA